ncbi:membrane protein [Streptomyces sp. PBH53]|uniref:hypothetical protein n=1 Tax=Streptomyces TaxID=1883 RepID=UPI000655727C|nr:hypothetical protein [Streptomyces sp. PBH53]AKN74492.1 membrane protein [Streptomyces sp. PBH53]
MRSARMLLATAAATAALAFATPGAAFAVPAEHDDGRDDSSYSKEHDSGSDREDKGSDSDHDKNYGNKRDGGEEHDGPRGGMHTGGGALAAVRSDAWGSGDDSRFDPESYRDKGGRDSGEEKSEKGDKGDRGEKGEWGGGGGHDRPRGGMHTGGGGLATPGVTASGLAVLGVGAAGAYALRRRKAAEPAS